VEHALGNTIPKAPLDPDISSDDETCEPLNGQGTKIEQETRRGHGVPFVEVSKKGGNRAAHWSVMNRESIHFAGPNPLRHATFVWNGVGGVGEYRSNIKGH
jgi:hypothetical protein